MNFLNVVAFVVVGYLGFVVLAEILIGFIQPDMDGVVVLVTTDAQGQKVHRKLAGFEHNKALYISSNHWLRGWYYRTLDRPTVDVTHKGVTRRYKAVQVEGAERKSLSKAYKMGFVLRFICGFAPSRFLRLDPV